MKRILIVDDSQEILDLTGQMLKKRGYKVTTLLDGEQTLSTIEKQPPHLILLDMILIHRTGAEICDEIKSIEKYKNIPIIISTGANTEECEEGFCNTADDYLPKPFELDELLSKIENLLTKHSQ